MDNLTGAGKEMKKLVRKVEKNAAYDSEEDENPYASSVSIKQINLIYRCLIIIYFLARGRGGRGAYTYCYRCTGTTSDSTGFKGKQPSGYPASGFPFWLPCAS